MWRCHREFSENHLEQERASHFLLLLLLEVGRMVQPTQEWKRESLQSSACWLSETGFSLTLGILGPETHFVRTGALSMKKLIGLSLGFGLSLCNLAVAFAQDGSNQVMQPPKVLVIMREFLKPGKAGSVHEKSESAFVKAMTD